jgi:hypothetical protein
MHPNNQKPFTQWMEANGWTFIAPAYPNAPMHFTRIDGGSYLNEQVMHAIYDERGGVDELADNWWAKFLRDTQEVRVA